MATATRKNKQSVPPFGLIFEEGQPTGITLALGDFRTLLKTAGLDIGVLDDAQKLSIGPIDEDAEDIAAYEASKAEGGERIPSEVIDRLIDGDNPIKVFREWRGFNQKNLAAEVGIASAYLSQLETGVRTGSNAKLRAVAKTLDIDFALLIDWCSRPVASN